jgi:hypothetical protein
VVYFFREVLGVPMVTKEALSRRTNEYRYWVEGYARKQHIPIEWAEKGFRKEDYVLPALRRMEKNNAYGVYFPSRKLSWLCGTTRTVRAVRMLRTILLASARSPSSVEQKASTSVNTSSVVHRSTDDSARLHSNTALLLASLR